LKTDLRRVSITLWKSTEEDYLKPQSLPPNMEARKMYANQRFINATSRGRAAAIASEIAPAIAASLAAYLRERPPPAERAEADVVVATPSFILACHKMATGEMDTPYTAPAEQPNPDRPLTAAERAQSAALIRAMIEGAPAS
jgi:hypothetical protein